MIGNGLYSVLCANHSPMSAALPSFLFQHYCSPLPQSACFHLKHVIGKGLPVVEKGSHENYLKHCCFLGVRITNPNEFSKQFPSERP